MRIAKKNRAGMTLVETLIAVTILGFGLTVMMTAISRCLVVFKTAKQYHQAQGIRTRGELDYPLFTIKNNDEIDPDDFAVSSETYEDEFIFSREVEDPSLDEENEDGRMLILTTKVTWPGGRGKDKCDEVVQYVYFREED